MNFVFQFSSYIGEITLVVFMELVFSPEMAIVTHCGVVLNLLFVMD